MAQPPIPMPRPYQPTSDERFNMQARRILLREAVNMHYKNLGLFIVSLVESTRYANQLQNKVFLYPEEFHTMQLFKSYAVTYHGEMDTGPQNQYHAHLLRSMGARCFFEAPSIGGIRLCIHKLGPQYKLKYWLVTIGAAEQSTLRLTNAAHLIRLAL